MTMIIAKVKATILGAVSKPYDFNGNTGTSHKVRLLVDGDVFEIKSTPEQVKDLAHRVEKGATDGAATLRFTSPKERLSLALDKFE